MDVLPEIRRLHFVEHVSISELARRFQLSRPTIRKHLKTLDEPIYSPRQSQPHVKLGAYIEPLTRWLESDAALTIKKRQRSAQRLYECLQVEGYYGSYSAVQRFVKAWHQSRASCPAIKQAFVPLLFPAGETGQFDYCSHVYRQLLQQHELLGSMSAKGCCYERAACRRGIMPAPRASFTRSRLKPHSR